MFKGVKAHREVRTSHFKVVGAYKTVRYGWLNYFSLYIPEGSEVKRVERNGNLYILVIEPNGTRKAFRVTAGDAENPDVGTSVDERNCRGCKHLRVTCGLDYEEGAPPLTKWVCDRKGLFLESLDECKLFAFTCKSYERDPFDC